MKGASTREEFAMPDFIYTLWRFIIRFITPAAIGIIFLRVIGLI
jgi:hypothetical protein